jgi:hypothetical protein
MLLNGIFDSIFTYIVVPYLTKFGIASLVRMKKIQLMYVFAVLSSLLYMFQVLKENGQNKMAGRQEIKK